MSFDGQLEKSKIRSAFSNAAKTYDTAADLQRRVGRELLAQIKSQNLTGTVLDIGCGTGFLTRELLNLPNIEHVIALDIALPMLQTAREKVNAQKLSLICADAEHLPLANQSVQHIVSNLALQWCKDLTAVFKDFKRVLKTDGQLLFSTFGSQTLQELKAAWAKVDDYSHVNTFYTAEQIREALQQAGFQHIQISEKIYLSQYESVLALMRELKAMGAHNVTAGRCKSITGKAKMQVMMAEYEKLRTEQGIPATFEIIYVMGCCEK